MHMPPLKDKNGHVFEPQNLLLHNNESSMLFIDKMDKNRLINFDLEAGKVVEEFNTQGQTDQGIKMITNEFKNAQNTAAQLFHGVSRKNVFTIDPRLNTKSRIAVDRPYKTDY